LRRFSQIENHRGIKVKTKCKSDGLNGLFKQARKEREKLLDNELVNLINIQDMLCNIRDEIGNECIKSVYQYPLIEIEKLYTPTEIDLEDEAITSFFYLIPDVGASNRRFINFPVKYNAVLVRVSGPSIMTTKMSTIMRAKLINLLYESALYKMRVSERKSNLPCKKIYGENYEYLRNYIAQTFFNIESESSGIETGPRFQVLSFPSAFGAFAGIVSISYAVFHKLPFPLEVLKTWIAIVLIIPTIIMMYVLIRGDKLK